MQCMSIQYQIKNTQLNNITKYSKTQKKIQKPQNLGLKCMDAWRMKVLGHLPSDLILLEAENVEGKEIWVREKCLGQEKSVLVER